MAQKLIYKKDSGFTIIELLVVLLIILLLAGFIATTYAGIRQKERNANRENNLALIKNALELYYAQTYKYPTLSDMNNPTWRSDNLKNFDSTLLIDPSSNQETLSDRPMAHTYAYVVSASDGTACNNTTKPCAEYTLVATLEGGGHYSKSSLN